MHAYAQAMFNIRREQGRLAEVEDAVRGFVELYPALPAWRGALALLLVELGREDEARAEFEGVARGGFAALPRDANWLIGVTLLAEVCGALGDGARAEALYALLEPYAGRNVVVGRAATCNGSASRLLGMLAAALRRVGRWPSGTSSTRWRCTSAMGARPLVARTQLAWAEMLLARRARATGARARAARRRGGRRRRARDGRGGRARAASWCATPRLARVRRRSAEMRIFGPGGPIASRVGAARDPAPGGEPVRPAAYRHDRDAALHHRLRLLLLRRRGAAVARAVPRLRRVEHARRGGARRRVAASAAAAAPRRGGQAGSGSPMCAPPRAADTGIGELDRVLGGGLVPGLARAARRSPGSASRR